MRFKLDKNLHPDVALLLRDHGYDAVTVWDQNLRGATDSTIADVCKDERRALVSADIGFGDIRTYPPDEFSGIVILRLGDQSRISVLQVIQKLLPLLENEPLTGRLWIVQKDTVRFRGGTG